MTQLATFVPDIKGSVRATRVNWDTCCVQPASFYAGNETKFTNQWTILKQSLILNFILISRTCWAKLDLKGCTCSSFKKKNLKRRKLQAWVFFSNRTGRKHRVARTLENSHCQRGLWLRGSCLLDRGFRAELWPSPPTETFTQAFRLTPFPTDTSTQAFRLTLFPYRYVRTIFPFDPHSLYKLSAWPSLPKDTFTQAFRLTLTCYRYIHTSFPFDPHFLYKLSVWLSLPIQAFRLTLTSIQAFRLTLTWCCRCCPEDRTTIWVSVNPAFR